MSNQFQQPLVNDQRPMSTTPEGRPNNLDLSSLRPLPKEREVGSGVKKPESQQGGQNAAPGHVGTPVERQSNQVSNVIFPSYLDDTDRHFAAEWIQPKKEVLHGWDNFAELAFDMANCLHKPDNAAIPPHDIDARDHADLYQSTRVMP
jgi:hypothetical protein